MAGRVEEARKTCAVALQMDPTQRISNIKKWNPYARGIDAENLTKAYRIAGIPE
jgi:hypothetical protein